MPCHRLDHLSSLLKHAQEVSGIGLSGTCCTGLSIQTITHMCSLDLTTSLIYKDCLIMCLAMRAPINWPQQPSILLKHGLDQPSSPQLDCSRTTVPNILQMKSRRTHF